MTSYHPESNQENTKNDSVHPNYSKTNSNQSDINSLRKLFEGNFNLSNFTKPFKLKNDKGSESNNFKENERNFANITPVGSSDDVQFTHKIPVQVQSSPKSFDVRNCKIKNCCCKTFFQEECKDGRKPTLQSQNEDFKSPPRLNSSSSVLTPGSKAYATLVAIPEPHLIRRLQPRGPAETTTKPVIGNRNRLYDVNYEFYKCKGVPRTFVNSQQNILKNDSDKKQLKNRKDDSYSKSELNFSNDFDENYLKQDANPERDTEFKAEKSNNFNFKCRLPKMRSFRDSYHPYWLKNPRPTVKRIKSRNMKNVKRKQQLLSEPVLVRNRTFNGYDNFAYSRSLGELHLSNRTCNDTGGEENTQPQNEQKVQSNTETRQTSEQLVSLARIQRCEKNYVWPVANLYIEKNTSENEEIRSYGIISDLKYSSSYDELRSRSDSKMSNYTKRKSNLKRHCSLGYLDEDGIDYKFTRSRRSVDNLSKITSSYGIKKSQSKQIEQRFSNVDIHAHALFAAIEHGYLDKTKTILDSSDVDVNSENSDGLSPLDVAVLINNYPIVKLLISHGAREGKKFHSTDEMYNHLHQLLKEAEFRLQELSTNPRLNLESSVSSVSSSTKSAENSRNKVFSTWEKRAKGLRKMLTGFELINLPDPPSIVTIEVTSVTSIMVRFTDADNQDSSFITKYKIQWSADKNFIPFIGNYEMTDTRQKRFVINNLQKGGRYYVRVASGNIKGYSSYKISSPAFVSLSSWRDITEKESRFSEDVKESLKEISNQMAQIHPYLKSSNDLCSNDYGDLICHRKKKTAFKQLFTYSTKFQKHLKRGVYLSCLWYHEDKILVTNEEFLPVLEIDENYPKNISNDFYWLFKVQFNWNDVKWLRSEIEKFENNSSDFRIKLLQTVAQMQVIMGVQDLGKVYYKMIRDSEGTIVIPLVNYMSSTKNISTLNLKWISLYKLVKRANLVKPEQCSELLLLSVLDQITYHQASSVKLSRGLYLGYLKMTSSVDSLQVFVPSTAPNIPPHCKIRDNPYVTAEEWEWLVKKEELKENLSSTTPYQRLFLEQFVVAARKLFKLMEVTDDEAANHRMYDAEVIEVDANVNFILIVQPASCSASIFNSSESLLQRSDLLSLAVQIFDTTHFGVYQTELISKYSRLSCILEIDTCLAQHYHRQAFSSTEVAEAMQNLVKLENLQNILNAVWKKVRWLLDVTLFTRDRQEINTFSGLLSLFPERRKILPVNHQCFTGNQTRVSGFHYLGRSRSEQHLTLDCGCNKSAQFESYENLHSDSNVPYNEFKFNCQPTGNYRRSVHGNNIGDLYVTSFASEKEYSGVSDHLPSSAKIMVYAAYKTGLESPPKMKFHVGPKTTAREIVELFVKQTNVSILLKGNDGPIYSDEQISNFCLVAVVGTQEQCLNDDFKPLYLQSPWKDGQLYVKRKTHDLTAVEANSRQPTYV